MDESESDDRVGVLSIGPAVDGASIVGAELTVDAAARVAPDRDALRGADFGADLAAGFGWVLRDVLVRGVAVRGVEVRGVVVREPVADTADASPSEADTVFAAAREAFFGAAVEDFLGAARPSSAADFGVAALAAPA